MDKEIAKLKYWLRIHRIPLDIFGKGGSKNNPIKVRTKKCNNNNFNHSLVI